MSPPESEFPNDITVTAVVHVTERRLEVGKIILHQARPDRCMVRNTSAAGGLLFVDNAYGLPEEFDLQMDGYSRRWLARGRRLDRIGVKFKSITQA